MNRNQMKDHYISREEPVIDDPVKVKEQMYFISSWDASHDS